MKILFVNYMETKSPGGINKTVKELSRNLSRKGHDVVVIQPNIFNLSSNEIYDGFRIIRINSWSFKHFYGLNLTICKKVKDFVEKFEPHVVHIHGCHNVFPVELLYYLKIKHPNRKYKLVFSPHLDVANSSFVGRYFWNLYKIFLKRAFNFPDVIVAASKFEAKNLVSFGLSSEKIQVIGHGVDAIDLSPPKKIQDDETLKLIYAGHFIKRKGVDYIIETIDFLINKMNFTNVVLTLIGEGPEKKKLKKIAKKFGVDQYIVWKHFLPKKELIAEIQNSDILLLLSESEAYGIIVAESLAYGTPVIVTKRTALNEFLDEEGCYGVDYLPKPEEIADLILELKKRRFRVENVSERIRTWDKVADYYENLYNKVL